MAARDQGRAACCQCLSAACLLAYLRVLPRCCLPAACLACSGAAAASQVAGLLERSGESSLVSSASLAAAAGAMSWPERLQACQARWLWL